jgi:hypothetical protein
MHQLQKPPRKEPVIVTHPASKFVKGSHSEPPPEAVAATGDCCIKLTSQSSLMLC